MADGPWQKYQRQSASGPWEKYARPGGPHPQATGYGTGSEFVRKATEFLGHVNRPIMGFVEGMSDAARAPARAFANEDAQRALDAGPTDVAQQAGVAVSDRPPQNVGESAAEGLGLAATALLPTVGGSVAVGKAAAGPVGRAIGSISNPFFTAPLRTTGAELGIGAAMGAGGQTVAENAENIGLSPETGRVIGETAAGLGAGAAAAPMRSADKVLGSLPGVSMVWRMGKRTLLPFTEAGARQRASDQLRRQSGRPEQDIEALAEPSEVGLTPAQQTGNPRLMQMERTLRHLDPEFDEATRGRIENSYNLIRQGVENMSEGATAQESASIIRGARQVIEGNVNRLVAEAERNAGLRLAEIGPEIPREEAAKIYRDELEKAYEASQAMGRQLWADVPNDIMAPTSNAKQAYQNFVENDASATLRNMPEVAEQYLAQGRNTAFGDEASVKELQGLRSELLEVARNARTGSGSTPRNDKMARYASELADAIEQDIASLGEEVSVPLRIARDHTRLMKERFRQGTVGDILGLKRTGAQAVSPETTLAPIAQPGVKAAVSMDELRTATQGAERGEQAAREFLRDRFTRYAMGREGLDAEKGRKFLAENDELLNRFPDLKQQISGAVESGQLARQARQEADTGLREAAETPGARFSDEKRYGREFETLRSPQEARQLVAEAKRRDPSGRAVAGIKNPAISHLIRRALSPQDVTAPRADPKDEIARAVLSNEEKARINRFAEAAKSLRTAETVGRSGDTLTGDLPAEIMRRAAQIAGAGVGRSMGTGTIQTPGFVSSFFRNMLDRLTTDKAEKLLQDAVKDRELMRSLMISPGLPQEKVPRALRAWVTANIGAQGSEAEPPDSSQVPWKDYSGLSSPAQAATRPDLRETASTMASRFGVPPDLFQKVIQQESDWNPRARSPKGAFGLTQVMPATAEKPGFGVAPLKYPNDPKDQLRFGAQYLGALLRRFGGDTARALVAYNWGPKNAARWDGRMESLPAETRNYVRSILPT